MAASVHWRTRAAALLVCLFLTSPGAAPQVRAIGDAGGLDPTFGAGGKVLTAIEGSGNAVAIQADGKIVVAGDANCEFAVARFTATGSLDTGFGTGGIAMADFMESWYCERALAVAIGPDGKIVAAGSGGSAAHMYSSGFALARFNSDGSLDTTFGTGGKVFEDFGDASNEDISDLALQADGKIVAAGGAEETRGWVVARYKSDGSPDRTFDGDGYRTIPLGGSPYTIAMQADGRIVVAGGAEDMRLARLDSDGRLDSMFGTGGLVTIDFGTGAAGSVANAIAIQSNGRIVVAGSPLWTQRLAIARVNANGSLDTSFSGDGKAITPSVGLTGGLAIQSSGRIVAAGWASDNQGDHDFALVRFDPDGRLDAQTKTDLGGIGDGASAVASGADGKIVAVGTGGNFLMWALARYSSIPSIKELRASSTAVDFGSVFIGSPSATAAVTISNPSSSTAVTISLVELARDQGNGISVTSQGCPLGPLGPKASCLIRVRFAPTAAAPVAARLRIHSNAAASPLSVALAGTGLDPIAVAPAKVGFGSVAIGTAATHAVVTVSNAGPVPATVAAVSVGGANSTDFSIVTETCTAAAVAPSASCKVTVGFKPKALGTRSAAVTIRGPTPVGTRTVALTGTGIAPPSGVGWGSLYMAGPAYTLSAGGALGRTVQAGVQRLHVAYATFRIGSSWATDSGPYAGIYYVRGSGGATWSTPKRLNPTNQHAVMLGLTAAGSRVYVAWVSQTKIASYSPTAPRVLYVRVNTNHGSSTSWESAIRLTSTSGRVDYPTIAASGYDAHVAYTDSTSGSVKVATSRDRGATWKTTSVGTTTLSDTSGMFGYPTVAVSGSTVAVAWVADKAGTIKLRVSPDRGVSWGAARTVATQSIWYPSVAVRGSRIAVAWTTRDDVVVRQRTAGVWGDPLVIASLAPGAATYPYAPVVVLQDPGRIAVAWSEEVATDRADLRWAESADGGALWFRTQTIAAAASSSARRINDGASVVWPSAGTRYVAWNGWTQDTTNYRLYLRKGSGTPVGPKVTATVWEPDPDVAAPEPGRSPGHSRLMP